jgi:threonine dehydratase
MDLIREILLAELRIRPYVRETPLEPSPALSRQSGTEVYLKLENFQHTGSFKARGAVNKILSLNPSCGSRGVVAASTGNHGAAVAFAAGKLGIRSLIFVPEDAAPGKIEAMRVRGAEVRTWGSDCVIAETHAREYAAEQGMTYVSPYNDPQVVGGQGTAGVEIARQIDRVDSIFVALGGGGLIAGVAGYLKGLDPRVRVIGCSPAHSCVMAESLRAGRILELESRPTLSDGTAGGVEQGSITFDLCRELVDECALVTEDEIAGTLRSFIGAHHMLIEGAAAVAVAAFLKSAPPLRGRRSLIVVCGGNIGLDTLRCIL